MKILKILVACFAVLVLSAFFVFELIFSRSVDMSLSAYAEEDIISASVEPLSSDDIDPSIIDLSWEQSGFDQFNLNLLYYPSGTYTFHGLTCSFTNGLFTFNGTYDGGYSTWWQFPFTTDYYSTLSCSFNFSGSYNVGDNTRVGIVNNSSIEVFSTSNLSADYFSSSSSISPLWFFGLYLNNDDSFTNFSVKPMLVKGAYTAETMPAYQPNLKTIFVRGFKNGYKDGYSNGYDSGRHYGYNLGYSSGYDTGYDIGYNYGRNSQISEGLFKNPLDIFLQPITNFLNTDIFGSFSIGDGFTIAFFVMIALIFIKMFAGG